MMTDIDAIYRIVLCINSKLLQTVPQALWNTRCQNLEVGPQYITLNTFLTIVLLKPKKNEKSRG